MDVAIKVYNIITDIREVPGDWKESIFTNIQERR